MSLRKEIVYKVICSDNSVEKSSTTDELSRIPLIAPRVNSRPVYSDNGKKSVADSLNFNAYYSMQLLTVSLSVVFILY